MNRTLIISGLTLLLAVVPAVAQRGGRGGGNSRGGNSSGSMSRGGMSGGTWDRTQGNRGRLEPGPHVAAIS